jgi:hypothetical protein
MDDCMKIHNLPTFLLLGLLLTPPLTQAQEINKAYLLGSDVKEPYEYPPSATCPNDFTSETIGNKHYCSFTPKKYVFVVNLTPVDHVDFHKVKKAEIQMTWANQKVTEASNFLKDLDLSIDNSNKLTLKLSPEVFKANGGEVSYEMNHGQKWVKKLPSQYATIPDGEKHKVVKWTYQEQLGNDVPPGTSQALVVTNSLPHFGNSAYVNAYIKLTMKKTFLFLGPPNQYLIYNTSNMRSAGTAPVEDNKNVDLYYDSAFKPISENDSKFEEQFNKNKNKFIRVNLPLDETPLAQVVELKDKNSSSDNKPAASNNGN